MLRLLVTLALIAAAASQGTSTSCTVTSYTNVAAAVSSCSTIVLGNFTVPAGKGLNLNLTSGAHLTFSGTITFAYSSWSGPLVTVTGSGVTVVGASGSVLDGQGAKHWDGKGDTGTTKPRFFAIYSTGGSTYTNIKLLNCPIQCVSVGGSNNTLSGWNIDVAAGDSAGGHNTDGFDVSGNNINIENSVVHNQDDCVAITRGSVINVSGLNCTGGHGLSLSVGQSTNDSSLNQVNHVTFSNCRVINSDNAIHVKTHTDAATGYIKDVTYKHITMSGIKKYGINVQQDYKSGTGSGTAVGNIPITGLNMNNVTGTMTTGMKVYILCASGACSGWTWSGVSISGGNTSNSCTYNPSGFTC